MISEKFLRIVLIITAVFASVMLSAEKKPETTGGAMPAEKTNSAKVYFTKDISSAGLMKAFEKIRADVKGKKIGLKVHFGEDGNKYFVKPEMMKDLVKSLNATFVETNVLYVSKRRYTESHIALAKAHGFTYAPIDILDSEGTIEYPATGLKHIKKAIVGSHMNNYDTIVVLSHFKGHQGAGFGGAIKNVGMGMGAIAGKMAMHASTVPTVNTSKCTKCGACVLQCPGNAITIEPKVVIDPEKCIGCAKCIGVCPTRVYGVPWGSTDTPAFMEKLVEYAKIIKDNKHMVYINVLADISPDCDCMGGAAKPFVKDLGIMVSTDMLAIDAASFDMVNDAIHTKDAFAKHSGVSGRPQIEYGKKIGLGNDSYELIDLDRK
ncbi:MAG TPA: DUF362 domain-containing protein [bacterium]|nr:DUF362 domain-containing protein [bacterium]HPS29046.1 DUF362 domain-containing protein [bacterium]